MNPKFSAVLMAVLALALPAYSGSIDLSGGTGIGMGPSSSAEGIIASDGGSTTSSVVARGTIESLEQSIRSADDESGKHAEIYLLQDGGTRTSYVASFYPNEGKAGYISKEVRASQTIDISGADEIIAGAGASNMAKDSALARVHVGSDSSRAGFTGTATATATYNSAKAEVSGEVKGVIMGADNPTIARAKGSRDESPAELLRSTPLDKYVDCDLDLTSGTAQGHGSVDIDAAFKVDDDNVGLNDKIQDAVDIAQAKDTINVAAGTYNESVIIDKDLTINGAGVSPYGNYLTTIVGRRDSPVFTIGTVAQGSKVRLSGLAIKGGSGMHHSVPGTGGNLECGGGIFNEGILTVTGSSIYNNSASYGGGIYNEGTAIIENDAISGNDGFCGGGALSHKCCNFIGALYPSIITHPWINRFYQLPIPRLY